MKNISFIVAVLGLSAYFLKAITDAETVWLKDVTTKFQTDKRTASDTDLPDQLSFHLMRKSHHLTFNLKRNNQINPNADIYVVRKLNDGKSVLEKTQNLENEDVAYYQDRENGAFMTVRCVKRSVGKCDMVINGNIRIGNRNFDLRPSKAAFKSHNFLEITGLLGTQYDLQDQEHIRGKVSTEYEDKTNAIERNAEEKLTDLPKYILDGKDKANHFRLPYVKLSNGNIDDILNNLAPEDDIYKRTGKIRSQNNYHVEVAVLLDSSIWDLFSTMSKSTNDKDRETKWNMRRYYSHIMNGVDLLYKGIEDTRISIRVYVHSFVFFQPGAEFPYNLSKVTTVNETKMIDGEKYLLDLSNWDKTTATTLPTFDQAILFTKHLMYRDTIDNTDEIGFSFIRRICEVGGRVQVVTSEDYVVTVSTTAHELGHSLGAYHDGDGEAAACKAEDKFIMSPAAPDLEIKKPYSKNPWLFSNCSVESFIKTLATKTCVFTKSVYSKDKINEWKQFMKKLPGELYNPNEQCHIIHGPGSIYCGNLYSDIMKTSPYHGISNAVNIFDTKILEEDSPEYKIPSMICLFMYCTDPKTRKCKDEYWTAATGTSCGFSSWCIEGRCVRKSAK